MRNVIYVIFILLFFVSTSGFIHAGADQSLRPPAVPLITSDPYFSIWSPADNLYDEDTIHWTGKPHPISCLIRIDNDIFRLIGNEPADIKPVQQISLNVKPTQTIYSFENSAVNITITFMSPCIPDDLTIYSLPLTYITWDIKSKDNKPHSISIFFSASSLIAVNLPEQKVVWDREKENDLILLKTGSEKQMILGRSGDDTRIDWGYLYLAAKKSDHIISYIGSIKTASDSFIKKGSLPDEDDKKMPRAANEESPALSMIFNLETDSAKTASQTIMVFYDDIFSINYFGDKLKPYWRKDYNNAANALKKCSDDFDSIKIRCEEFDKELMEDLVKTGGEKYAKIASLAYRQGVAGNKLAADKNGQPLLFPKECFSNGCIATVDVIYPMAPQFILLNPALAKASVANILEYSMSSRWKFPFAPHDLGTYPFATGQVYGEGENGEKNQMPVEESGNMIILIDAIAHAEGNADFAKKYWFVISKWANYLKEKGLDPENQLCTDDFAGHLAHNTNLSAKAIVALAAYADLCSMLNENKKAAEFLNIARDYAKKWAELADDGDHYRLAFDKTQTWSQKYNLVWDSILGLNLFPQDIKNKEMEFYKKKINKFGLPLDNRSDYTKLDWIVWTASITNNKDDFETLISPIFDMLNNTPDRVPMTDWYFTSDARKTGFQARPVVGGVFIRMLQNKEIWEKYANKGVHVENNWACIPNKPQIKFITPIAKTEKIPWQYTTTKPAEDWFKPEFDDSGWLKGKAGFGTKGTPGGTIGTNWNTSDIWLRREFNLDTIKNEPLKLYIHHDEDSQVYINGKLAADLSEYTTEYKIVEIQQDAYNTLKTGKNIIAVHCHQEYGGQYIDAGFVIIENKK